MKKILLIINPNSGMKRANKYLTDIIVLFSNYGYITDVRPTMKRTDAYEYAKNELDKMNSTDAKDFAGAVDQHYYNEPE